MIQKMRKKLSCKKGFTLIELIVVIAILGILALIAIPRISGIQEDARKNADIANARTMASIISAEIANGNITADGTNVVMDRSATAATNPGTAPAGVADGFPAGLPTVQTSNTATYNNIHGVNFRATYVVSTGVVTIFAVTNDGPHQLYPTPGLAFQ